MKAHFLWAALVAVVLIALVVMERRAGAANARADMLRDSLIAAFHAKDSRDSAALVHYAQDTALERQRLQAIRARDAQLAQAQTRLESLQATLRAQSATPALVDTLFAQVRQGEAILMAQRDSALSLWRAAAASRDTLAALLAESQAQRRSLMAALIEARKQPLWDKPVIRWGALAAAYLLGKL